MDSFAMKKRCTGLSRFKKLSISFFLILPIVVAFTSGKPSIIKITHLEKRLKNKNDTTYIVNFWATWCVPCVQELPDLEKINKNYSSKKVKVLLVSLDFVEDYNSKLIPFIQKHGLACEVVLLDEVNGNYFIPKISNKWTGAIPGTLILNNKKKFRDFFERKVDYKFLEEKIKAIESK